MTVQIECTLVAEDRYFCNGTRLAFDYPWAVYIVNGDMPIPYYRIYINNRCIAIVNHEREAYDYLLRLTKERAHDPEEKEVE